MCSSDLAHHLDVGLPRQDHLHPGADQCVVIHQIDSNRHSRTSSNAAIAGQARQGADTPASAFEMRPGHSALRITVPRVVLAPCLAEPAATKQLIYYVDAPEGPSTSIPL